ncbi:MAG: bifunctional rhamnulose-1-phosphate aldolase/short-chain dehydrogenase [Phycisphaerae bacterium]
MTPTDFKHVSYLWDDTVASKLDAVERLVYRSNCLGADQRITNTGGGNTSSKLTEKDPLTGEALDVLWVKGSGGDLRTSRRENFASLHLDGLLKLKALYNAKPKNGPKTAAEDDMVAMYNHITFNLNPRASSIDTPLHGLIPHRHVDHMHPNAVIAVAACADQVKLTKEIYGNDIAYVGWQRPGFDLGLKMEAICREHPKAVGILMGQHGIINWHEDDKACYELTLSLIEKAAAYLAAHDRKEKTFAGQKYESPKEADRLAMLAEVMPWLRGRVSQQARFVGTYEDRASILQFVNSVDAPRLAEMGTSCPDHFLRTKIKPLYVDWDPRTADLGSLKQKLDAGLEAYRADYARYYHDHKHADSPAMRDPNPTVVLIPGLGMVAWGKSKSESRVTAEFYNCAVEVMRGAESVSKYQGIGLQEAFDIEYWSLEEAKLRRMPPEKELARRVAVVIGAGSGIGREVCHRLAGEGTCIAAVDLNAAAARETAGELEKKLGKGIGVAGSGISGCGDAISISCDITDRKSIRAMLNDVALAFGGVDDVIITAGIFVPPDTTGHIPDERWALTFAINTTGPYLVADEAAKTLREQGLRANVVITTSANAVVAKKGSVAYDVSKTAANHLIRELAIELAPLVRVNGVAPATVVKGSAMFPRDRVIASLAKYSIQYNESESDESLRDKLAEFYAKRTLTKSPIEPKDQAEAYFTLVSDRLSKTTGQVIAVDGGLHEAFLR